MRMDKKITQLPAFRLTFLATSLMCMHGTAFAMQELNEQSMRQVDGQDGLIVNTQYDSINIDRLYWEDKAGTAAGNETALRGYADGVSITGTNLGTTYKINTGSSATNKAGIDLKIESRYGTIKADSFKICDAAGTGCGDSIGGLAIQSQENATLGFVTEDALFNQNSLSKVEISLKRMNVFLTQQEVANNPSSIKNQLIFKDFNFNFTGAGYMYISEAGGLILETRSDGYVDLTPVEDLLHSGKFKPGLNIDIVVKNNTADTMDTTGAKGLIRIGASGRITDGKLVFRGVNGSDTAGAGEAILGKAFSAGSTTITPDGTSVSILGSSGIALRLSAKFTNGGTNPTVLELAHGGTNAYGVAFSNFTPLLIRKQDGGGAFNTDQAYFDSGNVYINLTDTKRIKLPENQLLNAAKFKTGTLTETSDYSQVILGNGVENPKAVVTAIRGMDFQAISRSTKFIASTDVTGTDIPTGSGSWGLGLPIYNLNGNLALYGATSDGAPTGAQRLGFALGITTEGVNKAALSDGSLAGSKTTSILLIDGKKYGQSAVNGVRTEDPNADPINYYIGVRNIDMLLSGYGTIGLEGGKVNINVPKFTFAASGEVAVGYLPGSQYKTAGKGYAPIDGFLTNKDVLFGLRLRMDGSVDMTLNPGTDTLAGNRISFDGSINLTGGAVQLVDPVDGSIVGLDNITGKIGFSNQIKVNKDSVDFNTAFIVNPQNQQSEVLRIKDLNFYPATGAPQRLGEMVLTGGKITSQFNIIPH